MKNSIYDERRLYFYVCLSLVYLYVANAANGMAGFPEVSPTVVSTVFKAIIAVVFLTIIPIIVKKLNCRIVLFAWASCFLSVCNLIFFPAQERFFFTTLVSFFTICFPLSVVCMVLDDPEYLKKNLLYTAYLMSFLSVLLLVGSISGKLKFYSNSYSMGFGYALTIPILILLFQTLTEKERRPLNIISLIILMITLLSFGSRGPLAGIALFAVFYSLRYFYRKRNYAAMAGLLFAGLVLILGFSYALELVNAALEKLGISSRTIRLLMNNAVLSETVRLSGRNELWKPLMKEISKNPFKVRGINAEWLKIGIYAHNMVIEILYQFGFLFGGLFLLFLVIIVTKQLVCQNLRPGNELAVLLAFAAFPGLMLSNSFWVSSSFWIWFGFSFGKWRYQECD